MTYLEILNIIKATAQAQPNVNSVVRNFLDLNREDASYSAVVIQDRDGTRDRYNEQDFVVFSWHLGYVDVLTYDESNRDDIFSTGINILNNITNSMRNTFFPAMDVSITDRYTTFDQRFLANCAGVYAVLTVSVPISECTDYDTSLFTSLSKTITSNGVYNYKADSTAWDSVTIGVNVSGGKTEEALTATISTNGSHHYDPSVGAVFASADITTDIHPSTALSETYTSNGVYAITGEYKDGSITVDVSSSQKPEETLNANISTNGSHHYDPSVGAVFSSVDITTDIHPSSSLSETYTSNGVYAITGEYKDGSITVDVSSSQKQEETLSATITTNGSNHYDPSVGAVFSSADISVDVHPSTALSKTYTSNGEYSESGEWTGALIGVDVHPSVSLSATYTSNGVYPISGEYKDGSITVSTPEPKTEEVLTQTITSNGEHSFDPSVGAVFSGADITVNVHPSTSLTRTYTSNSTYSETGEWTNATIAVDVHPSVSLSETYTSNGVYTISGEYKDGSITVDVSSQKPEETLSQTITANGSHHYDPTSGSVFSSADITVNVHPSASLSATYTSNGTYNETGEWTNASITVNVSTTTVSTLTQAQYDALSVKDINTIYLILN